MTTQLEHRQTSGITQSGTIRGRAAARGVYTGIARVVTSPQELAALQHGEVLVCGTISPRAATMLCTRAGAVVTDAGGVLSSSSSIAREYGLPAVVATGDATAGIRTGQRVTVDGTRGIVRLHN